jgi:hypothetical protein
MLPFCLCPNPPATPTVYTTYRDDPAVSLALKHQPYVHGMRPFCAQSSRHLALCAASEGCLHRGRRLLLEGVHCWARHLGCHLVAAGMENNTDSKERLRVRGPSGVLESA